MDYHRRLEQLEVLSELDESMDYEVDYSAIGFDKENRQFVLVTASGCSCWDGDYEEEYFNSLYELEVALSNDNRSYNPSILGGQQLISEAREKWASMCDAVMD